MINSNDDIDIYAQQAVSMARAGNAQQFGTGARVKRLWYHKDSRKWFWAGLEIKASDVLPKVRAAIAEEQINESFGDEGAFTSRQQATKQAQPTDISKDYIEEIDLAQVGFARKHSPSAKPSNRPVRVQPAHDGMSVGIKAAAIALGVSEVRIHRLVQEGRLERAGRGLITIDSVEREQERRQS